MLAQELQLRSAWVGLTDLRATSHETSGKPEIFLLMACRQRTFSMSKTDSLLMSYTVVQHRPP